MSRFGHFTLSLCLTLASSLVVSAPATAHAHDGHDRGGRDDQGHGRFDVDRVDFPVTLSDGNAYHVAGYLYHRGSPQSRVLQVVVHGGNYDHKYWDIDDLHGRDYSYARYMTDRGYAVLAIDQIGTGASSRPDGDWLTIDDTARALHQVVASMRSHHNPTHHAYRKIALVGHSAGSLTSIYTTGTYHDADALVTTGWLHSPFPLPFDPSTVLSALTRPYIAAGTFPEPFLAATFYHLPTTDPDMIHYDYTHLQATIARRQFLDLLGTALNPVLSRSTSVTEPVLAQLGDYDKMAPSAYSAGEASFYPNASQFTIQPMTEIGHDVNAHENHLQSWRGIDRWLDATLGSCRDD